MENFPVTDTLANEYCWFKEYLKLANAQENLKFYSLYMKLVPKFENSHKYLNIIIINKLWSWNISKLPI